MPGCFNIIKSGIVTMLLVDSSSHFPISVHIGARMFNFIKSEIVTMLLVASSNFAFLFILVQRCFDFIKS